MVLRNVSDVPPQIVLGMASRRPCWTCQSYRIPRDAMQLDSVAHEIDICLTDIELGDGGVAQQVTGA